MRAMNQAVLFLMAVILVAGSAPMHAAEPEAVVPFKIDGYIAYITATTHYLEMMIEITQGGRRMPGLDVRLNGQTARGIDSVSYNYDCRIADVEPDTTREVILTIAKKTALDGRGVPFITVKGKATSLMRITSPREGETISPHDPSVTVAYEGGMPPYRYGIDRVSGWVHLDIPGGCPPPGCVVPMAIFSPGFQYLFWVWAPVGDIRFSGPVLPASTLKLRQSISRRFTISALRRDG